MRFMQRIQVNALERKAFWIGWVIFVILIAECLQREELLFQPAAAQDTNVDLQEVKDGKAFFDRSRDEGKLTIRYFHLSEKEKGGDAIYIETPDGNNMLIDSGIESTGATLNQFLNQLNVSRLDIAVATHPHHDHIGGYLTIFQTKEVGQVMMPKVTNQTDTYREFMQVIDEKQIPVKYMEEGNQFDFGEHGFVEILNPPKGTNQGQGLNGASTKDINNYCMVMKIHYGERSFLFTCDIYMEAEQTLTQKFMERLDSDMMHAPHHGNSTSSSVSFVRAVTPQVTVISSYKLNSIKVMSTYQNAGSKVVMTGKHGHIMILSDGESIQVITQQ